MSKKTRTAAEVHKTHLPWIIRFKGKADHAGSVRCEQCNKHIWWIGKKELPKLLREVARNPTKYRYEHNTIHELRRTT